MKKLKLFTIVIVIFMAMPAASLLAQRKASQTSSGRAAYGYPADSKSRKKVKKKKQSSKSSKRKTKKPIDRKKNPWAG